MKLTFDFFLSMLVATACVSYPYWVDGYYEEDLRVINRMETQFSGRNAFLLMRDEELRKV